MLCDLPLGYRTCICLTCVIALGVCLSSPSSCSFFFSSSVVCYSLFWYLGCSGIYLCLFHLCEAMESIFPMPLLAQLSLPHMSSAVVNFGTWDVVIYLFVVPVCVYPGWCCFFPVLHLALCSISCVVCCSYFGYLRGMWCCMYVCWYLGLLCAVSESFICAVPPLALF